MATAAEVKALFRAFLRGGKAFPNYNIKEYIVRRAKEEFRIRSSETDPVRATQLWSAGKEQLEVMKRQAVVYGLYGRKIKNVLELEAKLQPAGI